MGKIPDEKLKEIERRTSIGDLLKKEPGVDNSNIKKDRSFNVCCVFHDDSNPSMTVTPDSRGSDLYCCHASSCGAGGSIFDWVQERENLSFPNAVRWLIDEFNLDISVEEETEKERKAREKRQVLREVLTRAIDFYHRSLMEKKSEGSVRAFNYLVEDRHFTTDTIEAFNIGYAPPGKESFIFSESRSRSDDLLREAGIISTRGGSNRDRYEHRIIFPIHGQTGRPAGIAGRVVPGLKEYNAKYINSPKTPLYDKSKVLFGTKQADTTGQSEILVVEGYTDVLRFWEEGVKNVVASCGTSFTYEQAKHLGRHYADSILFVFDGDESGRRAAGEALKTTLSTDVTAELCILEEGRDPDEIGNKFSKHEESEKKIRSALRAKKMGFIEFAVQEATGDKSFEELPPEKRLNVQREVANLIGKIDEKNLRREYIKDASREMAVFAGQMYELVQNARGEEAKPEQIKAYAEMSTFIGGEPSPTPKDGGENSSEKQETSGKQEASSGKPAGRTDEEKRRAKGQAGQEKEKSFADDASGEQAVTEETPKKEASKGDASGKKKATRRQEAKRPGEKKGDTLGKGDPGTARQVAETIRPIEEETVEKLEEMILRLSLAVGRPGLAFAKRVVGEDSLQSPLASEVLGTAWRQVERKKGTVLPKTLPYKARTTLKEKVTKLPELREDLGVGAPMFDGKQVSVLRAALAEWKRWAIGQRKKGIEKEISSSISPVEIKKQEEKAAELTEKQERLNLIIRGKEDKASL